VKMQVDSSSWQRHSAGTSNSDSNNNNINTSTTNKNTTSSATATAAAATATATNNNRTDQLFTELRQLIDRSGGSTPYRDRDRDRDPLHELLDYPQFGLFSPAGKMPPKKSGRAMLREEGRCRRIVPNIPHSIYTQNEGRWGDGDEDGDEDGGGRASS